VVGNAVETGLRKNNARIEGGFFDGRGGGVVKRRTKIGREYKAE